MNRKLKNSLGLLVLLIFVLLAGGAYIFVFQKGDLNEKRERLKELKVNDYNTDQLTKQYQDLLKRSAVLDSVLSTRKFNIPQNISSIKFFTFINRISASFSSNSQVSMEFLNQGEDKEFFYYEYKISGGASFNDLYKLIYAIEQSKELKKIKTIGLSNLISTDEDGYPHFLVNYNILTHVYYASNNRFSSTGLVENNLIPSGLYDIFYPLIRNEIAPNTDFLLDVQGAKLLALIPEGAFIADSKGNSYLLWEGDEVYLGYLTKIDYKNNRVSFVLNKGGIIEKVELDLESEKNKNNNLEKLK
ncbi:MAG: hypothetical protein ABI550_00275 [Ignavibacteriaceae bacterium]